MSAEPVNVCNLAERLRAQGVRVEAVTYCTDLDVFLPDGSKGAEVLNLIREAVGHYSYSVFRSANPADKGAMIARVNFANADAWQRIRKGGAL